MAVPSLPVGTSLTLVADQTVDARVRAGSEFRAHLRDPLELGSTLVATAGTPARLVVTSTDTPKDGVPRFHIAIIGLNLGLAGTLPVRPDTSVVEHIVSGMPIRATTLATIAFEQGKLRVAIPLPFTLSNETPHGAFTPAPLRTANPIVAGAHRPRGQASATPGPAMSPTPLPSAMPTDGPQPAPASSSLSTASPTPSGRISS